MGEWKAFTTWDDCGALMAYETRKNLSRQDNQHEYLVETRPSKKSRDRHAREYRIMRIKKQLQAE